MVRNAPSPVVLALLSLGVTAALGCYQAPLDDLCGPPSGGGATPSEVECPAANPVSWRTETVSLAADDFWIVANGQKFTSHGAHVDVHSDPGDPSYTTLELIWQESAREMRFFLYFSADPTGWQVDELRTYDAEPEPNGDWLFYDGPVFRSPLRATFKSDVDLTNEPTDALRGELHLHGLRLSTTLTGT